MKEIGIPKIIYTQFSTDFTFNTIKNYLNINFNKEDKILNKFIKYDNSSNEIKFTINDISNENSQNEKIFIDDLEKLLIELINDKNNSLQESSINDKNINYNIEKNFNLKNEILNEDIFYNYVTKYNLTSLNYTYLYNKKLQNFLNKYLSLDQLDKLDLFNLFDLSNKTKLNNDNIKNYFNDNKNKSFSNIKSLFITKDFLANFTEGNQSYSKYPNNESNDLIIISNKTVKINLRNLLTALSDTDLIELTTFKIKLHIKNVIKNESGKWPSLLGNAIAFDSKYAVNYINYNIAEKLKVLIKRFSNIDISEETIIQNLNKTNTLKINEYTPTVNIILEDKFNIYKNDENNQRRKFAKLTDSISKKLGLQYPINTQIPLYVGFKVFNIVKIFLKNIFNSIIFFLWILSFMLVYSLILSNVDEKNYEFGMLRSLGFKKSNLILVIIYQSLFFSLPAIFISIIFASIVNIPITFLFFNFAGIKTSYFLTTSVVILGVFCGITLPLISSYFPVQKALASNLKDSLSIFNKKISDVTVNIVKLEKMGISPALTLTSIILVILGFLTYYIAPLSFLNMDYSTFLFILNSILIMMIIGLILLMQVFVPRIQTGILSILMLLFRRDINLKFIIAKNLDGHHRRNQKSSIMFMIALSFIIFAGCTIMLICNFIISVSKNVFGSDIWVGQFDDNNTLDEKELVKYLIQFDSKFPISIRNYTFISMNMKDFLARDIRISTLNGKNSFNSYNKKHKN